MPEILNPSSECQPSGVPWLGDVPAHWDVLPHRAIFMEVNDQGYPDEQMLSVTIAEGVIRQQTLLEGSAKKDASRLDRSAYKLVQPGDIAYNKMRAWQGAIGVSDYRGIVSPAYAVRHTTTSELDPDGHLKPSGRANSSTPAAGATLMYRPHGMLSKAMRARKKDRGTRQSVSGQK